MRYLKCSLWILVAVVAAVGILACRQESKPEPLLLLEDATDEEDAAPPAGPVADNSRCHVCHINYEDEALAVVHRRANIGCEQCHGSSDAHCNDEDNITPPDIMYPRAKINTSCMVCHPQEKIGIPVHKAVLASMAANKGYCTDCHGDHRLGYRTRRWDKATGELIEDDKVRMMTDEMLQN